MLDIRYSKAACAYRYHPTNDGADLQLVAVRKISYDRKLTNFNSGKPSWEEVKQMVEQQALGIRGHQPTTAPNSSEKLTMMAKMFYTLDEAKNVLGRGEDEIKQYAREGRLREFRDGPRLMFKADQVEQLRSELSGGGDQVDIGVSDSGGMIDLVDTTAASGTSVTLTEASGSQGTAFGSGIGSGTASRSGSSISTGLKTKDDTALATDLGLSGTATGIPSPGRPSGTGLSGKAATPAAACGNQCFRAPMICREWPILPAQTSIAPASQEINLESVGSGSGLLDLSHGVR